MRPTLFLLFLCTCALADPAVKLQQDAGDTAPGQWFDLRLKVDPKDTPIAAEGLEVTPEPLKGVEFDAAIIPAPDAGGAFTKPFTIRVPGKIGKGRHEVAVNLRGRTAAGETLDMRATGKIEAIIDDLRVAATASLKAPAVEGEANAVVVKATVAEGYHVYGTATKDGLPVGGTLVPAPGTRGAPPWTGGGPSSPKGDHLEGTFSFEIPFTPSRTGTIALRVLLEVQVCDEASCLPNAVVYVPLSFDVERAAGGGSVPLPATPSAASTAPEGKSEGLWELIVAAIGAGLLALLMPCTYPLIPITISFFTKQADAGGRSVVPLAIAYGAGIVAIFTAIGALVGGAFVAGDQILEIAAGSTLNLVFALLFLAFGLSLVGLYEIRLPSFFDNIAAKASGSGGYLSVFAMGLTLVVTSFTCTVPFIGSLLVLAAKDGEAGRAVLAMAVFGLTMAVPFVFLSLSPKGFQALPKSGEWMKRLKVTLGIVELGLVLKFVSNVDIDQGTFFIGRELFLVLWAVSFLAAGLYLLGFFDLFARGVRWTLGGGRAVAGLLMLGMTGVLAYGATGRGLDAVLGSRAGSTLESFLPQFKADYSKAFLAVAHDYEEGLRMAKERNAPIFLHFTGFT